MGELAVVPVLFVRSNGLAKLVELVHIRVELGAQVEGVVHLRYLDTYAHVKQAPVHRVGDEVIASRYLKLVDQAHHLKRLLAGGVLAVDDLHLQVVVHREVQHRGLAAHRVAVDTGREARVDLMRIDGVAQLVHFLYLTSLFVFLAGIDRFFVAAVVAPALFLEVGVVAKRQARRQHVAELLHFAILKNLLRRRIESVQLGRHRQRGREIEHVVEARRRVGYELLFLLVEGLIHALEVHPVGHRDAGGDTDVFEQHKRRLCLDRVFDTGLPVAEEVRV